MWIVVEVCGFTIDVFNFPTKELAVKEYNRLLEVVTHDDFSVIVDGPFNTVMVDVNMGMHYMLYLTETKEPDE